MSNGDMSRRAFLGTAALVGGSAFLTACGGSSISSSNSGELKYWYWADNPRIAAFFKKRIAEFNSKQKDIRVVGEVQPSATDTKQKIIQISAAGSGLPDVVYSNTDAQQPYYDAGITHPVQDYFDKWDGRGDIFPKIIETQKLKPSQPLLYMPWGIQAQLQFYRSDLYQASGVQAPQTMAELVSATKTLTKAPDRYGFGIRGADLNGFCWDFLSYLIGMGINVIDESGNTDLDSDAGIAAADTILNFSRQNLTQPSALSDGYAQLVTQFQQGRVAYWAASTNLAPFLVGTDKKFADKVGMALWPAGNDNKRRVTVATSGNCILKSSKKKDEAWEFIKFLVSPDVQAEYAQIVSFSPVSKIVASQAFFQQDPAHRVTIDSAPYYATYPFWNKNWSTMETRTGLEKWQSALQGKTSTKDLMSTLADEMRKGV